MKKKYKTPKDRQKEVNIFFSIKIKELADDTIDKAFKLCYEEYKLYPNVFTVRIIKSVLNTKINVDISINEADKHNIPIGELDGL